MKSEDYERPPCACERCVVAGVSDKPQRRDPWTGIWLHGRELANWYRAKADFDEQMKAMFKPKVMP